MQVKKDIIYRRVSLNLYEEDEVSLRLFESFDCLCYQFFPPRANESLFWPTTTALFVPGKANFSTFFQPMVWAIIALKRPDHFCFLYFLVKFPHWLKVSQCRSNKVLNSVEIDHSSESFLLSHMNTPIRMSAIVLFNQVMFLLSPKIWFLKQTTPFSYSSRIPHCKILDWGHFSHKYFSPYII